MSKLLDSETFGDKIYNRFPEVYKKDDKNNEYYLKRYISTAGEGFKCVIDETNGITDLKDYGKIDSKFLPVVYASHGIEIFNGLPELYLRNLIPILNPLLSRKGSLSAIEYLCSIISGIRCTVDTSNFSDNNRVNVVVDMDSNNTDNFPSVEQMWRILREFVPFYCNVSLVFSYKYQDTISVLFKDSNFLDVIYEETNDSPKIVMADTLEDESRAKSDETFSFGRDLLENTNFLNSRKLYLNGNLFLNSWNGYDTITINGSMETKAYY